MRPSKTKRKRPAVVIKRRATELGAPTARPVRAVVLALDAASTTGYAVYITGQLFEFGELDARDARKRHKVVSDAITTAEVRGLPLVCALEVPSGGFAYARTALALHAVVALWRDTWSSFGQRAERVFEVAASEWRRHLFGRKPLRREQARDTERLVALARVRQDMRRDTPSIGGDAAAAICIGQVFIRSSALEALVAKG